MLEEIQGDLYERYDDDLAALGPKQASRRYAIQPAAIVNESPAYTTAAVKLQHPDLHTTLPRIEKSWNKLFPEGVYPNPVRRKSA